MYLIIETEEILDCGEGGKNYIQEIFLAVAF